MHSKQNMYKKKLLFCLLVVIASLIKAQDNSVNINTITSVDNVPDTIIVPAVNETIKEDLPVVSYSINSNKKYVIAEIHVTGAEG